MAHLLKGSQCDVWSYNFCEPFVKLGMISLSTVELLGIIKASSQLLLSLAEVTTEVMVVEVMLHHSFCGIQPLGLFNLGQLLNHFL